MITRECYLNALELIDQYHQQLNLHIDNRKLSWEYLQCGDKIIFDKVMSKYLTEGKEYSITGIDPDWKECYDSYFEIIDDKGKKKGLKKHAKGYVCHMI